jgi:hypothetical protein
MRFMPGDLVRYGIYRTHAIYGLVPRFALERFTNELLIEAKAHTHPFLWYHGKELVIPATTAPGARSCSVYLRTGHQYAYHARFRCVNRFLPYFPGVYIRTRLDR